MQYERIPWSQFQRRFQWKQGQHVLIIAPTGYGKTTLLASLLNRRNHVCILVSKTKDETFRTEFPSFSRVHEWRDSYLPSKVLLWPKEGKTIRETKDIQRTVFRHALDRMFRERGWCVVFDEQYWACQMLGLSEENAAFQHVGRSSGLSAVNLTQRPAWVPVVSYSASDHAFLARTSFRQDLKRLSDLGGVDAKQLGDTLLKLPKYDFVYVNTRHPEVAPVIIRAPYRG